MNLILWRHAEAEDISPDKTDEGRRLTEHGRNQASKIAGWLNTHLADDVRILVSPAVRTQQTAQALGRKFETEPRLSIYSSYEDHLLACEWETPPENGTVLLVGHQPTLGQIAAYLLCGAPQNWEVKRGSIWWIKQTGRNRGAQLNCVLTPKLA